MTSPLSYLDCRETSSHKMRGDERATMGVSHIQGGQKNDAPLRKNDAPRKQNIYSKHSIKVHCPVTENLFCLFPDGKWCIRLAQVPLTRPTDGAL